ncbi:unnamed protein product [Rotaria sp. Silwood1]|nr:unnamed protein product [Rotaria sp. Silwood1]
MVLPSSKYTNQQNKSKQQATISSKEPQFNTSSFTKALTNTQNTDPLFKKTQNYTSSQIKAQNSLSLTTGRQTQVSTSTKVDTSVATSIKPQIINPRFEKTQTNTPLQAKPQTSTSPTTERQNHASPPPKLDTNVPTAITTPIVRSLFTKTQANESSQAKPPTSILPPSAVHISIQTTKKLKTSVPLPTETQAFDSSSSDTDIINILLLGETGVGKSTFINAFVNYLTFASLKQAESSKSVVLIPVSFLMTVGDNFEEHIVKFGDIDDSNNEDFDHPGQSVTQHCKSYVFYLNGTDQQKLRIIDTPGFGDTRGIEQDDLNMEHILEYVNNLSHLNAICFLLKPNASRLNISFRSCITQLFSLLDQNALNNIIFCFTNSRSTFYTPGDTAPLLKKMLISLSIGNVPFKKENIFCFDSESFRYLVALQNGIEFNGDERQEYEMSWSTSVNQSNRLIGYIRKNIGLYHIDGTLQSMKHVQYEINHMVRPMLETMRNYLRNLILRTKNSIKASLKLHAKDISFPATLCISCVPYALLVGQFWIAKNIPHKIQNNHCSCECSLNQHIPIDYILEYKSSKKPLKPNHDDISDLLHKLCYASAELSYFLVHSTAFSKSDPFLTGFVQIIIEENYLCGNQKPNDLNLLLTNSLRGQLEEYKKYLNEIESKQTKKKLSEIYELINSIRDYPMMHEQMIAVNKGQKKMMELYECKVGKKSTKFDDDIMSEYI